MVFTEHNIEKIIADNSCFDLDEQKAIEKSKQKSIMRVYLNKINQQADNSMEIIDYNE